MPEASATAPRTRPALPTDAEVAALRAATPGCEGVVHLNNAGSALPSASVHGAVVEHLERERALGGYEAAAAASEEIEGARRALARLVGVDAHRLALVENATVAFAQALATIDFEPGDRIVTSRLDYPSNQTMFLSLAARRGVEVVRAEDRWIEAPGASDAGRRIPAGLDPASVIEQAEHPRTRLVALSWVPTSTGLVQDVAPVGAWCREHGVPFLLDACQAVGQIPVDGDALGCDYLAATGRKFLRGPRGTGFLAVSERVLERGDHPLLVDLRGATWSRPDGFELAADARRFENWEFAWALVLGLGRAAEEALETGVERLGRRAATLARRARERLAEIPGVTPADAGWERPADDPGAPRLSAIAGVHLADGHGREISAARVVEALRRRGVHTSATERTSGLLDMAAKGIGSTLRVSPHAYNTEEEIEALAGALEEVLEETSDERGRGDQTPGGTP